jgi:hypothetical protein
MICALSGCLEAVFGALFTSNPNWYEDVLSGHWDSIFGRYYKAQVFFGAVTWFLDLLIHCFFVMKYWVASCKI